jgi:hypothetical protein
MDATFLQLGAQCVWLIEPRPGGTFGKPDSGHADTISITVRLLRTSRTL